MMNRDSDDRLSRLIEDLGTVDPPAGLTRQVMAQISHEAQHKVQGRIIPFNRGGIAMTRKAMWGLAAAAVIVLGIYTYTGFPPVGGGTEGTIGAAQKYQAPQISDKDVTLGDGTAQEFLQSEAFDQLAKDPEARDLISDVNFRNLLRDVEFRNAIANADVRNALSNQAVHKLFESAEMRAELENQLKANMSAELIKQGIGTSPSARAAVARILSDSAMRGALSRSVVRQALASAELRQAMANARMARALSRDAFVHAVAARGFAASLQNNALAAELSKR